MMQNTASPAAATPYRSPLEPGRDGFGALVRSEWTKLRTVRGWLGGLGLAGLIIVLLGVLGPLGSGTSCHSNNPAGCGSPPAPTLGPGGEPVTDDISFVHKAVTGDGTLTARLTAMAGYFPGTGPAAALSQLSTGLDPWARAGIIVKASATPGAAYVALVATGDNGVRLESDFTSSRRALVGAGSGADLSAAAPQWLRLSRTGDMFTGYASNDGVHWTAVGTQTVPGIASDAQAGLLAATPDHGSTTYLFGGSSVDSDSALIIATFDNVAFTGSWAGGAFAAAPPVQYNGPVPGATLFENTYTDTAGVFEVHGSGDLAPQIAAGSQGTVTLESGLIGAFAGLIALIVVATMFITSEYRRGLIRTTLSATPRRGAVLAAKAVVIGAAAFAVGLAAAAVAVPLAKAMETSNGAYVLPTSTVTELRVVAGTAALLAAVAVFALAVGTLLRHGAGAVALVIAAVVLPYVLAVASVLPTGAAQWLMRLTPAAGFAIQQTVPRFPDYPQVASAYVPAAGYYPLPPWAGLAVTCGYAAVALALAIWALRRRDA